MNRWRSKAAAVLVSATGIVVLAAGTAQAHVRVSAPQAVVGKPATFDFRMPSEEQVASTIRLSVTTPADVTIASIPPAIGWITATANDRAGDTVVTWTAHGAGLPPAQSIDFLARAAALPNRPAISFDAVQTYSNGDTVYWTQAQTGGTQPPYPAPALKLAGATPAAAPDRVALTPVPNGAAATNPAAPVQVKAASAAAPTVVPGWAIGLAIGGGLAIAAAAVTVAVTLLRRQPRSTTP